MKVILKKILNATITGSPTITSDFVASGFSADNYLTVSDSFDVSSGKTWEMVYKVKTGTNITTGQTICGHTGSSNNDPVSLVINSGKFAINLGSSSSAYIVEDLSGTYAVKASTTYWMKFTFNGSKYVVSYSLDGIDYVEDIVVSSTKSIWTSNLVLGRQQGSASEYPWLGTIDLESCYININGKRWWNGVKTIEYKKPCVLKRNKTIYYKYGTTPNAHFIGSTTISNGVASGFSTDNYGFLPSIFSSGSKTWEIVLKVNFSNVSTRQHFFGSGNYNTPLFIVESSKFRLYLSGNGSSWNIASNIAGTYTVLANTNYWVKLKFTGSAYILSYSTNGSTFTNDITISSTTTVKGGSSPIVGHGWTNYPATYMTIDFNQSYINIDGKLWWNGTKAEEVTGGHYDYSENVVKYLALKRNKTDYYKYTSAPNIEMVGSPTISSGVISGFSSSNYALTPGVPTNVKNYEMVAKFTTGTLDSTQQGILGNSTTNRRTPQIVISTSNTLAFDHPHDADTWKGAGGLALTANTTYWAKFVWDGDYIYSYYKTSEAAEWILYKKNTTSSIYWTEQVGIGIDGASLYFKGSIDLKGCYININGQRWWSGMKANQVTSGSYDYTVSRPVYLG